MKGTTVVSLLIVAVSVTSGTPGAHSGNSRLKAAKRTGLRRTRVTSRKLGDADRYEEDASSGAAGLAGLLNLENFVQPAVLLNIPQELISRFSSGSMLNLPNIPDLFGLTNGNVVGEWTKMLDTDNVFGQNFPGNDIIGQAMNRAKEMAGGGVEVIEKITNSVTGRGKGVFDVASEKAQSVVDRGLDLGSSAWHSAEDAARDLREESRSVAGQAAAVAEQGMKFGEKAVQTASQPINVESFLENLLNKPAALLNAAK